VNSEKVMSNHFSGIRVSPVGEEGYRLGTIRFLETKGETNAHPPTPSFDFAKYAPLPCAKNEKDLS
jgi:hypothetical protein